MQTFETDLLTHREALQMTSFLDREIGTEYEVNDDPAGSQKVYICIFDLTPGEVSKIRGKENSL